MSKPRILYLSCHAILEYDELKIFEDLGYDYFSMGAYINPANPADQKRPALKGNYNDHLVSLATRYSKDNLHPELIEPFDVIVVSHIPEWVSFNWEKIKHKRVIWRSIGQSVNIIENQLAPFREQGLEVVRYSPKEETIPGYIGADAVIRFGKDPDEFKDWNGKKESIMTAGQSMKKRGEFCNYDTFHRVVDGLPAVLYGPENDDAPENGGQLSFEDLKGAMRDHRAYMYTGTHPASYTLSFIEAMMTGIPIVSIGNKLGNSRHFNQQTFEVPDIITNGQEGFVDDDPEKLREYLNMLLSDHGLARAMSDKARRKAVELFGIKTIREQWRKYLEEGPQR